MLHLKSVLIGIGATALMDVWALFLHAAFKMPLPNWALVGRWFCCLTQGAVFHDDIARAEQWPCEKAVGWIAHYAIGVFYAVLLIAFTGPEWLSNPTFLPAWILGMITIGAGWFLLQPGMGGGLGCFQAAESDAGEIFQYPCTYRIRDRPLRNGMGSDDPRLGRLLAHVPFLE